MFHPSYMFHVKHYPFSTIGSGISGGSLTEGVTVAIDTKVSISIDTLIFSVSLIITSTTFPTFEYFFSKKGVFLAFPNPLSDSLPRFLGGLHAPKKYNLHNNNSCKHTKRIDGCVSDRGLIGIRGVIDIPQCHGVSHATAKQSSNRR